MKDVKKLSEENARILVIEHSIGDQDTAAAGVCQARMANPGLSTIAGGEMKKIIIKLYDWSQTPVGDSILGGLAFLSALATVYWFFLAFNPMRETVLTSNHARLGADPRIRPWF